MSHEDMKTNILVEYCSIFSLILINDWVLTCNEIIVENGMHIKYFTDADQAILCPWFITSHPCTSNRRFSSESSSQKKRQTSVHWHSNSEFVLLSMTYQRNRDSMTRIGWWRMEKGHEYTLKTPERIHIRQNPIPPNVWHTFSSISFHMIYYRYSICICSSRIWIAISSQTDFRSRRLKSHTHIHTHSLFYTAPSRVG